jgi:hypothetical protein
MVTLNLREVPFMGLGSCASITRCSMALSLVGINVANTKFEPYPKFDSGSDIIMTCESTTDNNINVISGFDLILIENK